MFFTVITILIILLLVIAFFSSTPAQFSGCLIAIICLVGAGIFIFDSHTHIMSKNITINDKFIINGKTIVIGDDCIKYKINNDVLFSSLKVNNTYNIVYKYFDDFNSTFIPEQSYTISGCVDDKYCGMCKMDGC